MTTYKEFAEKHGINIVTEFLGVKKDEGWEHLAFSVTLQSYINGPGFTTTYKMGMANALPEKWQGGKKLPRRLDPRKAPKVEDVLSALATDTGVIQHDSFESWASDFGYDLDSRKAEKMYRACRDTAEKLTSWLGLDVLSELLSCPEE